MLAAAVACAAEERESTPGTLMVATGEGTLFVRTGGRGPDLVLLHGLGDASDGWRKVEQPLRDAGFRVTVWDALGAGRSDKPEDGDYRLAAHAERLAAVLDHLGIEQATLVGNSLGGSVALLTALAHPQRVAGLVLVDPAAFPEGGTTASWFWDVPGLAQGALEALPPEWIARLALTVNYGNPLRITAEDLAVYTTLAARPGVLRGLVLQERQLLPTAEEVRRWHAGFRGIEVPVLVLWGSADRVLPQEHGPRLTALLPRARLVVVEGVGHVLQMEDPERFLAEVLGFLGAEPGRR